MNKIRAISVLILLTLSLPVIIVQANVPSVLSLTRKTEGGNTVIDVKVSNIFPSSTHYIASITLDIDGTQKTFADLTKATTDESTYSLNIGSTNPKTIKAQAVCIVHGPSSWFSENTATGSTGGIPGYPLETIIIGSTLAIRALITATKKR